MTQSRSRIIIKILHLIFQNKMSVNEVKENEQNLRGKVNPVRM
jgi:hypothetical protein